MTFAIDIAGDFEAVADDLEAITLRGPSASPNSTTVIEDALRRSMRTYEAAASDGRYLSTDTVWHFDKRRGTPEVGGTITDTDGTTWRIIDVDKQTLKNRWRCVCRENKIEGGLDTYVTISRREWTKAPDGSAVQSLAEFRTNVRAKIQERGATREVDHGRRGSTILADVYFEQQFLMDQSYVIIAQDGTQWVFISDSGRDLVTGFYSITVERSV